GDSVMDTTREPLAVDPLSPESELRARGSAASEARSTAASGGPVVHVGGRAVGRGQPVYVIAEIGINHNGSLEICEKLIEGAVHSGCNAVKFQKRTPELCVPLDQWNVMRDTPWGRISYIDYKRKIEFGLEEFSHIDRVCQRLGVPWFASAWY